MSDIIAMVPAGDPLIVAWDRYKQTARYANTRRWAAQDAHVDGSLWAAYCEGHAEARAAVENAVREALGGKPV